MLDYEPANAKIKELVRLLQIEESQAQARKIAELANRPQNELLQYIVENPPTPLAIALLVQDEFRRMIARENAERRAAKFELPKKVAIEAWEAQGKGQTSKADFAHSFRREIQKQFRIRVAPSTIEGWLPKEKR